MHDLPAKLALNRGALTEFPLRSGQRVDVIALSPAGTRAGRKTAEVGKI